jgi:hypothetical protein
MVKSPAQLMVVQLMGRMVTSVLLRVARPLKRERLT